jgi:elongation factor P
VASLIQAIEIKRKMFFEFENAPYHCLDVEVSRPTARGGQTLVRIKMRNLLTRAVFDKTFKAGEKFGEPDLVTADTFLSDASGYHTDQRTTKRSPQQRNPGRRSSAARGQCPRAGPEDNGSPIGLQFPAHVELTVINGTPWRYGQRQRDEARHAETGLGVPLFIKEGEKVKVHTETREFAAGRGSRPYRSKVSLRDSPDRVLGPSDRWDPANWARRGRILRMPGWPYTPQFVPSGGMLLILTLPSSTSSSSSRFARRQAQPMPYPSRRVNASPALRPLPPPPPLIALHESPVTRPV